MSRGYEVGGDVAGLRGLASEQQGYIRAFRSIMSQIEADARTTLGAWDGGGSEGFSVEHQQYQQHFTAVNAAFARLVDATDGAADNYGSLLRRLDGMFGA